MKRARGFTLIELLVVMAIIAVLAAIVFPVFGAARGRARRTVCISNLRQIGMAMQMYRQDNEEFPERLSACESQYVRDQRVFLCPNDQAEGKHEPNPRIEGATYLPTGVSYDYIPQWTLALRLGWWDPMPRPGRGKWDDLTPLAFCHWHWATRFDPRLLEHAQGSRGWVLALTAGASVRRLRVEDPIESFTPDRYR